jgi:hypothetical protein
MNCEQYRAGVEEAAGGAGRLPRRAAASHAEACAACRAFGEETAALRELVAALPRVDAPADFEFRLRARMNAADSARAHSWSLNLLPRAAGFAAAGALALAAAVALQTRNSQTPGPQQTMIPLAAEHPAANPVTTANAETMQPAARVEKSREALAAETARARIASGEDGAAKRKGKAVELAVAARGAQRKPADAGWQSRETVAGVGEAPRPMETRTSGMTGSPIIVSMPVPLPVSADERPLQVLFKDAQGGERVVNVDPITFGSNEPAARPTSVNYTKASKKQGVW